MNGFEETIEELRELSRKKPLPKKELVRAKELMGMLREWVLQIKRLVY